MKTYTLENLTTNTYRVYISDVNSIRILPGFNFNLTETYLLALKQRTVFQRLFEQELFLLYDVIPDDEIQTEDNTDVPFIDIVGEKVPVTEMSINGSNSVPAKGYKFKSSQLKAVSIPTKYISMIVQQVPEAGWKNAKQIIDAFELKDDVAAKVESLFSS